MIFRKFTILLTAGMSIDNRKKRELQLLVYKKKHNIVTKWVLNADNQDILLCLVGVRDGNR